MDWNLKNPTQWDWESLGLHFGEKESENPRSEQESQGKVEGDGVITNGSVYSSEVGAYSGSEYGSGCSPKGSIAAAIDFSSKSQIEISEFDFQSVDWSFQNPSMNKEFTMTRVTSTSPCVVSTACHGEQLIGLKLGKRTYFEDVFTGNNIFSSSSSSSSSSSLLSSSSLTSVMPAVTLSKKSKVSPDITQSCYCQVEGCHVDLITAKEYHRKHRVCESHSKCPKVIVAGQERRFCQQCSRFHELSEFDLKKRSCRRRLSDHNARRRKPQPDLISFSSGRFSPSLFDGRHMNLIFNKACPTMNSTQDALWDFKLMHTRGSIMSAKTGSFNEDMQFPSFRLSNTSPTLQNELDRLLSFKGTTAEALIQDPGASDVASILDGALDLRRALSLLSNDPWSSSSSELGSHSLAVSALPAIRELCQDEEEALVQQVKMQLPLGNQANGNQYQLPRSASASASASASSTYAEAEAALHDSSQIS